jgi:FkbM family methyltransferase
MSAQVMSPTRVETMYGRFHCWQDDLITEQLQKFSAHTRNELGMLKTFVHPGDRILDIGAHIGTFSVPLALFTQKKGHVYSFEANPRNFELLTSNVKENGLGGVITPTHAVIAERDGQEFGAELPTGGNSGMYYFSPDADAAVTRVGSMNIDAWRLRTCPGARFDLIKIDVEGAEMAVLRSCASILSECLPVLYIEMNRQALGRFDATYDDVDALLRGLGYHYFRNVGERNSANDHFVLATVENLRDGGDFFDVLAIHPQSARYPKTFLSGVALDLFLKKAALVAWPGQFIRRLRWWSRNRFMSPH